MVGMDHIGVLPKETLLALASLVMVFHLVMVMDILPQNPWDPVDLGNCGDQKDYNDLKDHRDLMALKY